MPKQTKFVFVTGGVVSSLGKGLVSASIGALMGVLMLVASKGSTIRIKATGDDCDTAVDELVALVADGFGE